MQTFLPHIKFHTTMRTLSDIDLDKQCHNALRILRAALGHEECRSMYQKAWEGYGHALGVYALAACHELRIVRKLFCEEWKDISSLVAQEDFPQDYEMPPWIGDLAIHRSHRSVLIRSDSQHYGPKWPNTPERMPLLYPEPDDSLDEYRLRISPVSRQDLRAGLLQLPLYLRYDEKQDVVVRVPSDEV